MDFFMPAERVLYDRSYYFSDEAVDDYNEYIADRDGVNVDVVSSLDFFMNEVWKEIDYAISRARGHFPDATVAAWAAARSVNESDGYLGIKDRM